MTSCRKKMASCWAFWAGVSLIQARNRTANLCTLDFYGRKSLVGDHRYVALIILLRLVPG